MSSAQPTTAGPATAGDNHIELAIGGMTCASCAARIEKKLNKLDGVAATVNFATETASVDFPSSLAPETLVETVEKAGYRAVLPSEPEAEAPPPHDPARGRRG